MPFTRAPPQKFVIHHRQELGVPQYIPGLDRSSYVLANKIQMAIGRRLTHWERKPTLSCMDTRFTK